MGRPLSPSPLRGRGRPAASLHADSAAAVHTRRKGTCNHSPESGGLTLRRSDNRPMPTLGRRTADDVTQQQVTQDAYRRDPKSSKALKKIQMSSFLPAEQDGTGKQEETIRESPDLSWILTSFPLRVGGGGVSRLPAHRKGRFQT